MYTHELTQIVEEHGIEAGVEAAVDMVLFEKGSEAAEPFAIRFDAALYIEGPEERGEVLWTLLKDIEEAMK